MTVYQSCRALHDVYFYMCVKGEHMRSVESLYTRTNDTLLVNIVVMLLCIYMIILPHNTNHETAAKSQTTVDDARHGG